MIESRFYDRAGDPITFTEWNRLWGDPDYKRIGWDDVTAPDGGICSVSTVWLGIDHGFRGNAWPIIFQTMVFTEESYYSADKFCIRTSTEKMARKNHALVCRYVAAGLDLNEIDP